MIPIRDYPPSKKTPIFTIILIVVNVLIFLYQTSSASGINMIANWAFIPADFSIFNPTTWYTLITYQFLHGDFWHLALNMWFLWIFADNIEEKMKPRFFLLFYLFGGAIAALLEYAFVPGSTIGIIGASGSVSAVLGYYLIRFPDNKVETIFYYFVVMLPAKMFLVIWFIIQFYGAAMSLGSGSASVAWWAHVGGFVFGAIVAKMPAIYKRIKK